MSEPISAIGTSPTWQTRLAAMQQQLSQTLFKAADTNGDGTISKSEFESFYTKFMGATSQSQVATQTAAADQLFQQLDTQGIGQLNATQFAAALKQIMSQQAHGHHHHHVTGAVGAVAQGASQSNASSAAGNPAALLNGLFSTAPAPSATAQASLPQNSGSLEFTA
jgi:hypothetical protein